MPQYGECKRRDQWIHFSSTKPVPLLLQQEHHTGEFHCRLRTGNWTAIQKIWKYTYICLWEMESSLRDHQQDEASHSKFCCRKNKGWWEGKWVSVHWGSEGLSIPGTGDERWKSNSHLKSMVENTPHHPPKTRTMCYLQSGKTPLRKDLNWQIEFQAF